MGTGKAGGERLRPPDMRRRAPSVNPGLRHLRLPGERLTAGRPARLHGTMTGIDVIAAFAREPSAGNPAGVCIREHAADPGWMQRVARTMALSETAFLHRSGDAFSLRWFTPTTEVDLCGHATLASAFVLWETAMLTPAEPARFHTRGGLLTCRLDGDWITMDFPSSPVRAWDAPATLARDLGGRVLATATNGVDGLVEVPDAATLRGLQPDWEALARLGLRGVIATCRAEDSRHDFLSRFFAPSVGVNEDPVTGSAHCALAPYWAPRLGRSTLVGYQASARGGTVQVELRGDRVLLSGQAVRMRRVELPEEMLAGL